MKIARTVLTESCIYASRTSTHLDPTTRRIWFGIATAHDFESHDGMTEDNLYQKIFASHFGQLAIIFLWTSGNLFHVAWQLRLETVN